MKNKNSIQLDICEKESIANNLVSMKSFSISPTSYKEDVFDSCVGLLFDYFFFIGQKM